MTPPWFCGARESRKSTPWMSAFDSPAPYSGSRQDQINLAPSNHARNMNALWQDIQFGSRTLARNRGFIVVAALSLALGIGLNTAIFTLVNAILLGSLPFQDADRLVAVFSIVPQHPDQLNGVSVPDLFAWKD